MLSLRSTITDKFLWDTCFCPRTERAVSAVKARRKARKGKGKHPSKQRYSTYDIVHVILEANIKTRLELIGLAVEQKKEGRTKLAEFIANIIYS